MLKGNLSTRPFYNDRLVAMTLGVIALGVIALMAFNATQLISLSKDRAKFDAQISKDAAETRGLTDKAAQLRSMLDRALMKQLQIGADEANDLIDRRTFSWTELLSVIEKTMPIGARLIEVAPKPDKSVMHIDIIVVCKTPEDLFNFVQGLENTNMFRDVVPTARNPNEDNTETATVQSIYLAPMSDTPAPPKKSGKGRP